MDCRHDAPVGGTDQKVEMTDEGGFACAGAPDEANVHIAPAPNKEQREIKGMHIKHPNKEEYL
jgi:hypothetical protein